MGRAIFLLPSLLVLACGAAFAQDDRCALYECAACMEREYSLTLPANPSAGDMTGIEDALRKVWEESDGFCAGYQLGRLLIIGSRHEEAITILEGIDTENNEAFLCCNALFNLIGFAYLQTGALEMAVESFKRQIALPEFQALPERDRMKTFNNLGYTLIQLGRYEEARASLDRARILGSDKAEFNLAKINSIVESLSSQDPSLPGAFALVIAYSRDQTHLEDQRASIADTLQIDVDQVQVFTLDGERFYFTYGAYMSYPMVEDRLTKIQASVEPNAWISLTTEWTDISQQLRQ